MKIETREHLKEVIRYTIQEQSLEALPELIILEILKYFPENGTREEIHEKIDDIKRRWSESDDITESLILAGKLELLRQIVNE